MDIIQNLGICMEIKEELDTKQEFKQKFEVKEDIKEEFIENNLVLNSFFPKFSNRLEVEYLPKDEFSKTEQDAIDIIHDIEVKFEPGKEDLKSC